MPSNGAGTGSMPAYMRSKTRPHAKTPPSLKRKHSDVEQGKSAKPIKLPRPSSTRSASHEAATDASHVHLSNVHDEVPRSMLSTFRVTRSTFQAYNGETISTAGHPATTPSDSQWLAPTGPEPMFDHSWRLAFVEYSHPSQEAPRPSSNPPKLPICALSGPQELPRDSTNSGDATCNSLAQTSGPVLRPLQRLRLGDENQLLAAPPSEISLDAISARAAPSRKTSSSTDSPAATDFSRSTNACIPSTVVAAANVVLKPTQVQVPPIAVPSASDRLQSPNASQPLSEPHAVSPLRLPTCPSLNRSPPPNSLDHRFQPQTYGPRAPHGFTSSLPPAPFYSPQHHSGYTPWMPIPQHAPAHFDSHPLPLMGAPFTSAQAGWYGHPAYASGPAWPFPSQPRREPIMPWSSLFDRLKKDKQRNMDKKKARGGRSNSQDACPDQQDSRPEEIHSCPLCPRTFSLPNSLALHLKWHWGASGLDWKRGELRFTCGYGC